MISRKAIPLSLAAMAAALAFTACDDSPSSPHASTAAEARADLQAMADKVHYFAAQQPASGDQMGVQAKRAAAKAGAADPGSGCELEATWYTSWDQGNSPDGDDSYEYDTTTSYTAAGEPICGADDRTAYRISSGLSGNAMLETRMRTRTDLPDQADSGVYKMTGSGTVRYKDGYLITIASMDIEYDARETILKTYVMNLVLEKGYAVVLSVAPGTDLMSETGPGPGDVAVSGPITKDGLVVGYFEVMGDSRVVIRDADKVVIESHG